MLWLAVMLLLVIQIYMYEKGTGRMEINAHRSTGAVMTSVV